MGRPEAALKSARAGAERAGGAAWPRVVLGVALDAAGRRDEATRWFEEGAARERSNLLVLGALVDAHFLARTRDGAFVKDEKT